MRDRQKRAKAAIERLAIVEIEYLRHLVAGESPAAIAMHGNLAETEALAVRQSLMTKLGASCAADAVREGVYAGL